MTLFVLRELPNLKWAVRNRRKSSTIMYVFRGQLSFLRRAKIPGCQALSKAPAMSRARRQHLSPRFLLVPAKSKTFFKASTVVPPAVKPNCSGDSWTEVSRK